MVRTLRVIGGAGTGKTTELVRLMLLNIERGNCDPYSVGFVSFTRAARQEAAARAAVAFGVRPTDLEQGGWFRTLHSICYRQLGAGKELLAETKADREWIEDATRESGAGRDDAETGTISRGTALGFSLACWDVARVTGATLREVVERQHYLDIGAVAHIVGLYEQHKRLDGRRDFTDLLGRFAGVRFTAEGWEEATPEGDAPDLPVVLLDESQDQSALSDRVARRIVERATFAYTCGDPFQCQPTGTPILTDCGYVPIEHLEAGSHRIAAYDVRNGRAAITSGFKRATRVVDSGDLIEVKLTDGSSHVCTTNHRWLVRTMKRPVFATYVMRKGVRWRVGTVQIFSNSPLESSKNKNGDFRPKMRMNQEAADSLWILKVFDTDREARMYEQIVSCRYGLPQVTFRPPHGKTNLDAEFIEGVFMAMGDLTTNGLRCLADHGLDEMFPFSTKADRAKNGEKASRFVRAVNLLRGIHVVPKLNESQIGSGSRCPVEWIGVESIRRLERGTAVTVYSLDVPTCRTYVTQGGVVTGNSIYGFAGSASRHFMGWNVEDQRILGKSFRCPDRVLACGERILSRCGDYWDRGIAPRGAGGEVLLADWRSAWEGDLLDPRRSTLLLARTNYQAARIRRRLDAVGIPWQPVDESNGGWRAPSRNIATKALYELQTGLVATRDEWTHILKHFPSKLDGVELFVKGTKTHFGEQARDPDELIDLSRVEDWGGTAALRERIASGRWMHLVSHADRYVAGLREYGWPVVSDPPVRVGTIHSAKGMEADDVLVLTTTSRIVEEGGDPDEERRLGYVAVTRARERCVLLTEGADCRMRELEDAA